MSCDPVEATFGAVVRDVEIRSLDEPAWRSIYDAWIEHALLIFPGQFLTQRRTGYVCPRFGELEFKAAPISNIGKDGRLHSEPDDDIVKSLRGNEGWHHDSTYMPVQAKGAVFSAEIFRPTTPRPVSPICEPRTRHLMAKPARIVGGSLRTTRSATARVERVYFRRRTTTTAATTSTATTTARRRCGRWSKSIRSPADQTCWSVDMPTTFREWTPPSRRHCSTGCPTNACQHRAPYYHHEWQVGDAIIWDNRRLMHCATPFDMTEPRRMWHTRIAGERDTELATNLAVD